VHTAGDPRPCVDHLHGQGFRCSLIKKRPTALDRACFDSVVDLDYQESMARAIECARGLAAVDPLHGVLSFSESGVIAASMIAAALGLPGNHPRAALAARNKYLMRCRWREAGLASPPFHLVDSAAQIVAHLRRYGAPMVLKPISGSSSYGVVRLAPDCTVEECERQLHEVRTYISTYRALNPQYPFEFWLPGAEDGIPPEEVCDPERMLLLEGFLAGTQVSVDGIVSDGTVSCFGVIQVERMPGVSHFVEYEEWMPTHLGQAREAQITAVVERAVHALGLTRSCFHCELKVGDGEPAVLEIAARRGADNISDFIARLQGVDIYTEGARLAVGEHRAYAPRPPRGAMKMRYYVPQEDGVYVGVDGVDQLRQDPRVSEVDIEFEPGDTVVTPPAGFEFYGYLSVWGPTLADAEATLEELYPRLRFRVRPGPGAAEVAP
jgi:biotin carboxylase